jgi:hypothetical protein
VIFKVVHKKIYSCSHQLTVCLDMSQAIPCLIILGHPPPPGGGPRDENPRPECSSNWNLLYRRSPVPSALVARHSKNALVLFFFSPRLSFQIYFWIPLESIQPSCYLVTRYWQCRIGPLSNIWLLYTDWSITKIRCSRKYFWDYTVLHCILGTMIMEQRNVCGDEK